MPYRWQINQLLEETEPLLGTPRAIFIEECSPVFFSSGAEECSTLRLVYQDFFDFNFRTVNELKRLLLHVVSMLCLWLSEVDRVEI